MLTIEQLEQLEQLLLQYYLDTDNFDVLKLSAQVNKSIKEASSNG